MRVLSERLKGRDARPDSTGSRSPTSAAGRRCCPTPTSRSCTSTPRAATSEALERARERVPRARRGGPAGRGRRSQAEVEPLDWSALLASAVSSERKADRVEPLPDLAALSDADLKKLIDELTEEEQEISYRRRLLHGKIDILRAELVARLQKSEGRERPRAGRRRGSGARSSPARPRRPQSEDA